MGSFRILGVPKVLQNDVECFIVNEFRDTQAIAIKTFPNGKPGIVFQHKDEHPAIDRITTQSGHQFSPPVLFLHGTGTEASVMNFSCGSYAVIQVILKPHALKTLLGINALALKKAAVDLNEFSNEDIHEQLLNARSQQERVDVLTNFLLYRFNQEQTRDELVEESLRLIHQSTGTISVRALLERLGISERQFERRFCQTVGLSPISYVRIRRFNEALRLIQSRHYDTLTEVAHALNFHDQSHFIRELKAFTDHTPKSISQKIGDFTQNQAGYSYI